jgi:hypothetical protein
MTDPAQRPLLFLDVDGTLLPYGGVSLPSTIEGWEEWQTAANPHLARLTAGHGPRLLALPCDLVWATAWRRDANDVIGPLIGLPELPVVDLPPYSEEPGTGELHWKTASLVERAAGRSFVWIDDEITDADRDWVSTHHPGRALLHRVDSRCGLTDADLAAVDDWLRSASGAGDRPGAAVGREDVTVV